MIPFFVLLVRFFADRSEHLAQRFAKQSPSFRFFVRVALNMITVLLSASSSTDTESTQLLHRHRMNGLTRMTTLPTRPAKLLNGVGAALRKNQQEGLIGYPT